jgi:hypothetical protein
MIVVAQIATPCATMPSSSAITRKVGWENTGPSEAVSTPPTASRTVIQAALDARLVTSGVITAAAPKPIAAATTTSVKWPRELPAAEVR